MTLEEKLDFINYLEGCMEDTNLDEGFDTTKGEYDKLYELKKDIVFLHQLIKATTGFDKDFYYIDKVSLQNIGGYERALAEFGDKDFIQSIHKSQFVSIELASGSELIIKKDNIKQLLRKSDPYSFDELLIVDDPAKWYISKKGYEQIKKILLEQD